MPAPPPAVLSPTARERDLCRLFLSLEEEFRKNLLPRFPAGNRLPSVGKPGPWREGRQTVSVAEIPSHPADVHPLPGILIIIIILL